MKTMNPPYNYYDQFRGYDMDKQKLASPCSHQRDQNHPACCF